MLAPTLNGAAHAEDAQPPRDAAQPPRDAAEKVQEGSVPQWLEYYQRERAQTWTRPEAGAPATTPVPAAQESAPPAARPADR
jgi:hypothetical protein